MTTSD